MAIAEGVTSAGASITNQLIDDGEITFSETISDVAIDYIFSWVDLDFTYGKNILNASTELNETIKKLGNRKNKKWAEKQIKRLKSDFNDLLSLKLYESLYDGILNMATDVPIDNWAEPENYKPVSISTN